MSRKDTPANALNAYLEEKQYLKITESDELTAQIMEDLHARWKPHAGQLEVGDALYRQGIKDIFLQCGRKYGKTELLAYALNRQCVLNPGSHTYYFVDLQKQAREILWVTKRLQNFMPPKYIKKIDDKDMRITFFNDSFIKLDGSDNTESARGYNPHFACYDEFKDFDPRFHEAFDPNRLTYAAPLIIAGTPPSKECQYTQLAELFQKDPTARWFKKPSSTNPYLPKEYLAKKRKQLESLGELDVYLREYEAEFIIGGKASIFPMFSPEKHIHAHNDLLNYVKKNHKRFEFFCTVDPGTTTVFAALFGAIDVYDRKIYILEEVYETDRLKTSVRLMFPTLEARMHAIHDEDPRDGWVKTYDEAAAWFANEVMSQYGIYFAPTYKAQNKKENGVSLIKDALVYDYLKISNSCINLKKELLNYSTDAQGNFIKGHDHLIDCLRYMLAANNYSMIEALEQRQQSDDFKRKVLDINHREVDKNTDWTAGILHLT